ncbi:ABC transporter substrate-binding protein [Bifidobacterium pseudolongum subsp. globosum]|uniref:transporter substrate-binding domain-containing protein n=1 Tax=Bifidobacterium TaxID=1678 RepID=UPI00101F9A56|nr:transporter substrate-binding domain-containing protein [Bifidobacterium pseudolongum]RYQ18694.1 ABC transporter substrate-binding protein [Bifidobacterium pseudolongum subsp. globosum]
MTRIIRRHKANRLQSIASIALAVSLIPAALMVMSGCGEQKADAADNVTEVPVAVAADSKPLSYTADDGSLDGYEVAVLKAVDEKLPDYTFAIEAVADDAEDVGIDTGKYALTTGGYFKTEQRERKYLLPEENTGVSLMKIWTLPNRTDIKTLDDLVGKKIAPISPNGGVNKLLTAYNEQHVDSPIAITRQDNVQAADSFKGLIDGKYDAVVIPQQSFDVESIEQALGRQFRGSDPVEVDNQYFLLNKSQDELYAEVNKAIAELKQDGTLKQLSEQYFGTDVFAYEE